MDAGGGVVPADAGERAGREAAGRLGCLLARRAKRVARDRKDSRRFIAALEDILKEENP